MKNLLTVSALFLSFTLHASISIVSDLDDTIKITNSDNLAAATYNAFFNTSAYSGVPEFLKEARAYTNKLYIVSGSPKVVRGKIDELIRKNGIKVDQVIVRESLNERDTFKYKVSTITKIMETNPDDFIFFGDDVEKDSAVYEEIKKLYPNRVLAIYIHNVHSRPVSPSAIRYWTAFDLTVREALANRMNPSAVKTSLQHLLNQSDMKLVFPKFADCPKTQSVWNWQLLTPYGLDAVRAMSKLVSYCLKRPYEATPILIPAMAELE